MSLLSRAARTAPLLIALALAGGCATGQVAGSATESPTAPTGAAATATPAPSPTTAVSDQDVQTPQPTVTAQDGRAQVLPSVTSAIWNAATGAVEVSAFVPVIETTGACELTLTLGATSVTAESVAYADASSTSCDLLSVPGSRLTPGTWQVVVGYSSPDSTGRSGATEVVVP